MLPFCSITLKAKRPTKPPQPLNTIGDHIRKRRQELKLTQLALSRILGVREATITDWEKNHTGPRIHLLPKIFEFLGYNPTAIEPKTLGERVLQYRKLHGISQKELAKRIGITQTVLRRVEKNVGKYSTLILEKVTDFLNRRASTGNISQA